MPTAYKGTKRMIKEHPNWLPVIEAALECAKENGEFPGSWVLEKVKKWYPGLRILVRYGILKHEDTTRSGRRAYYTMPDQEGVRKALQEERKQKSRAIKNIRNRKEC